MKKLLGLLALLALPSLAQFPALSPYLQTQHYNFEHVIEANGVIVVYGPLYKTSIRLDASHVHSGDSSVVGFVLGAHGSTNCNDPVDSCQRHRAYVVQRMRGHRVEVQADSTNYTGVLMPSPIATVFDYRYDNLVLRTRAGGNDWESPGTWCRDTTDNCLNPVTIVRDSAGYIHWEHVPRVDSATHVYQISLASDPTGRAQIKPREWATIYCYLDNDSTTGGWAAVYVTNPRGTFLHSTAYVHGSAGGLAQFHAGLYASPAVSSGSLWNDNLFIGHVPDTSYFKKYYLPTVTR